MEEFCLSLRIGGRVPREVCSDAELRRIFATVDSDKSGAVDAAEFCGWLKRTLALARSVTKRLFGNLSGIFCRPFAQLIVEESKRF